MNGVQDFRTALVESMGCNPSDIDRAGVTVRGVPSRAKNQVTAGYKLDQHLFVTCDPAVEAKLSDAVAGIEPTLDAWQRVANAAGGEFLGAGRMQLLASHALEVPDLPIGLTHRLLDTADAEAKALIGELVSVCNEDDLDEAELDMDALDDFADVIVDASGAVLAYGSVRPFDMSPGFGDIGVITRDGYRGRGLGRAVVHRVCVRLFAESVEPLYRCDEENQGSVRLSESMGFVPAARLLAFRFEP